MTQAFEPSGCGVHFKRVYLRPFSSVRGVGFLWQDFMGSHTATTTDGDLYRESGCDEKGT